MWNSFYTWNVWINACIMWIFSHAECPQVSCALLNMIFIRCELFFCDLFVQYHLWNCCTSLWFLTFHMWNIQKLNAILSLKWNVQKPHVPLCKFVTCEMVFHEKYEKLLLRCVISSSSSCEMFSPVILYISFAKYLKIQCMYGS